MTRRSSVASADENGTWSVVKVANHILAAFDGELQVGLSRDRAEAVAETLNAVTNDEP